MAQQHPRPHGQHRPRPTPAVPADQPAPPLEVEQLAAIARELRRAWI